VHPLSVLPPYVHPLPALPCLAAAFASVSIASLAAACGSWPCQPCTAGLVVDAAVCLAAAVVCLAAAAAPHVQALTVQLLFWGAKPPAAAGGCA